jgi:hypothetical protein
MNATKLQHDWDKYLEFYSAQNRGRPTRLGLFEPSSGAVSDYWIECGVPFAGINLSTDGNTPVVRIMVGTLTHEVRNVVKMSSHLTASGDEDGLDVLDADGRLTVLRFEENNASK